MWLRGCVALLLNKFYKTRKTETAAQTKTPLKIRFVFKVVNFRPQNRLYPGIRNFGHTKSADDVSPSSPASR